MYEFSCECGNTLTVRTGQAGGTTPCPCGRTVAVPLLSGLRRIMEDAGREVQPPVLKHDWSMWWTGIAMVVGGITIQLLGIPVLTANMANAAYLCLIGGYILTALGLLIVGLGKGFALALCLILFVVPFGGYVLLFFPGKGADRAEG